jgi:hypothetical protein
MSATVKTRTNYAVPHLLSAAIFSRRLGEIEAEHSGQDFGPFWDEILAHAKVVFGDPPPTKTCPACFR